jgi:hypothetical protein
MFWDGEEQVENLPNDQEAIIVLLNLIKFEDGGKQGQLWKPIVTGFASDELYEAIKTFEEKHFFGKMKGFVQPGDGMLDRMEELARRNTNEAWAKRLRPPLRIEPPKISPIKGTLDAEFSFNLAGTNFDGRPIGRDYMGGFSPGEPLGTLTLSSAFSAVPDGRGGYSFADWIQASGWKWEPSTYAPKTISLYRYPGTPKSKWIRGNDRTFSVPEHWLKPRTGLFSWIGTQYDRVLIVTPDQPIWGAKLHRIPIGKNIITLEERARAFKRDRENFQRLWELTGAPDFAPPQSYRGAGEFSNPDRSEGELQAFQWTFERFK